MCGTDAANGANGTNGARPNNKVRLARLHQLPYHLIDETTPSPPSHLPSVRWLPRYSHLYHLRAALSRRTRTSRPATTSQISPTSRSSSRLCVVRNRRHPPTPPTPPLTPAIEGEQFANAYFDTETKIKMLVSLCVFRTKPMVISC
jgi:hypothetical protein